MATGRIFPAPPREEPDQAGKREGKGAGVDESGGPRDGMGEDEAPAAGMLRGEGEWSGMARVRGVQDGYEGNRVFQSVGLRRGGDEDKPTTDIHPPIPRWGRRLEPDS